MFMMSNAVAQSAQPIISYNFGNHAADRVTVAFLLSLRVALLCGAIVTLGIFFLSGGIVGLFIPADSEAGTIAVHGFPIFSFCAVFFALNIAYIGYHHSMGSAARAITYTLLRGVILLVPLFFLLPSLFPAWGMWAAIPASELCTFLIILSGKRQGMHKSLIYIRLTAASHQDKSVFDLPALNSAGLRRKIDTYAEKPAAACRKLSGIALLLDLTEGLFGCAVVFQLDYVERAL